MDRLISEQAVLEAFREYQGSISDFYKAVKAIPSVDKGMTNGEVIKAMFPHSKQEAKGLFMRFIIDGFCYEFDMDWWNSPYEP